MRSPLLVPVVLLLLGLFFSASQSSTQEAAVTERASTLEVRVSGSLPFLMKIGPVGKDDKGETQYGTVYEDYDYDYPCEVLVGGKTQKGKLGVRDGQIVVRYSEDIVDLSAPPDPRFAGFRTQSKWQAVEAASSVNRNVWLIRAEKGSYLEATFTSSGDIGRLHFAEGARGVIPITHGANPITIGGTKYDPQVTALLLRFGHETVTVSRLSGDPAHVNRIALGALSAALLLVILTFALRKRRRLSTTRTG